MQLCGLGASFNILFISIVVLLRQYDYIHKQYNHTVIFLTAISNKHELLAIITWPGAPGLYQMNSSAWMSTDIAEAIRNFMIIHHPLGLLSKVIRCLP